MLIKPNHNLGAPNFVTTSYTIIGGTFKLETVQKSELNRAKPQEVKDNSLKLSQNTKSAKHSYLLPH